MSIVKVRSFPTHNTLYHINTIQMSQFHWHVVDSQSFPLYIPGYPELSEKGAYSPREIYSTKDVKEIVLYAGVVRFHSSSFPRF